MKRKPYVPADMNTLCTNCSYPIPPNELRRVSFDLVRCPKCGKDFAPTQIGKSISTS